MRYRLVTEHIHPSGRVETHVGSVLIPMQEVPFTLDYEADLHIRTGWNVTHYGQIVRAERNGVIRWFWVRVRNPLEDTL